MSMVEAKDADRSSASVEGNRLANIPRPLLIAALIFVALALVPPIAVSLGDTFSVRISSRIMILALAAISLDLIMGYGGMVSFGHAVFVGIGAYGIGIMSFYADGSGSLPGFLSFLATNNAFVAWPIAILVTALAALGIGYVALRTSGLYFLMITLAFAQMFFYFFTALDVYGGQDGMQLSGPSSLPAIDLGSPRQLYYVIWLLLLCVFILLYRLVYSRFGLVIRGIKGNKRRMRCLGIDTLGYRLACFVLAGAIAGLAGILLANNEQYVSPTNMNWGMSGELMMMCILGGTGTLVGPILGSIIYVFVEYWLSNLTIHWQIIFGPLLVLAVLFFRTGLIGFVQQYIGRRHERA